MGKKLPLHSEVPPELTWDLESLYPDMTAYEADFVRLEPLAKRLADYKGRLAESPELLAAVIGEMDDFSRLAEKLYTFAHLRSDEDTSNNSNRARVDRISTLMAGLSEKTAYFEPEIMAIPDARMAELLAAPAMAFYRRSMEELLREKPHILSEKEERILGLLSDVMGGTDEVYSVLSDADMEFGTLKDESGRSVRLTHGNYRVFMESRDRKVRRAAFRRMFGTYGKYRNTFAATLDGTVKRHVVGARLRNFPDALAAALNGDEIPERLYTGLIDAVHGKLGNLGDYLRLRQRVLDLDKLEMHDLLLPLSGSYSRTYSYGEAKKLVLAAFKVMGGEYCSIVEKAFEERWIDVMECRGKRSGAYSGGCYDSKPYLLLNYNGTLNDVFTLAHELGHSLHSYYSNRAQEYHYADYSIFVAEVASITNELLLSDHLMRQNGDPALRAYLLGHLADEIRGTVYRQTMFAEFELRIHREAAEGTPLTADLLDEIYYRLNDLYHDHVIKADRLIAGEWARIPHFYYNFYVYKYATGMAAATVLARNILSGDPDKLAAYFGFLSAGDSKPVLQILRDAGVDLETPEPVARTLDYFGEIVRELGTLLDGQKD